MKKELNLAFTLGKIASETQKSRIPNNNLEFKKLCEGKSYSSINEKDVTIEKLEKYWYKGYDSINHKTPRTLEFERTWCDYITPCPYKNNIFIGEYECVEKCPFCSKHKEEGNKGTIICNYEKK